MEYNQDYINALIGGGLIGIAVTLMLYWNGRVTGIAGIIDFALKAMKGDILWRVSFLSGLAIGGVLITSTTTKYIIASSSASVLQISIAGLLVGFGTVMGSGCTSGHGVCGISRLSPRSIIATLVFIAAGVLTVRIFYANSTF